MEGLGLAAHPSVGQEWGGESAPTWGRGLSLGALQLLGGLVEGVQVGLAETGQPLI